jgi:cytochrome c-type biogenesis protein CcmF
MSSPLLTGIAAGIREKIPALAFLPGSTSNVGQGYYNTIATPIAILGALMMAAIPLLSWQRTDLEKTYRKAIAPYLLACVVVGIAAACGVGRDRPGFELYRWMSGGSPWHLILPAQIPLLSLIFAGAMCLFMSLERVILTPSKIGRLGGFLSHAGIGLLLIGIVASELADKDQRASLVKGQPQQVMGYTVLYNGMYVPPGQKKPALDLTFTRGSETFKAPAPMYFSKYNQQFNYGPYIRKYAGHDLYIAPEGPPMSTKEMAEKQVELMSGQTAELPNGVMIRFADISGHGQAGGPMRVGAFVDVIRAGTTERVEPYWQAGMGQQVDRFEATTKDGDVTVAIGDMNASTHAFTFVVGGHALGEPPGPPQEIALLNVSTKPMINLVWLATLFVMCGGLLTVRRAVLDLRRGEAREREYYAEEDPESETTVHKQPAMKKGKEATVTALADQPAKS